MDRESHDVSPACVLAPSALLDFVHAAIGKKIPPGAPLHLNTATAAQLAQVPGIGASSAKAIVQFREKSGPFERVEGSAGDSRRGIRPRKLEQIRPYVTVSKPARRKSSSSRGSDLQRLANLT